MHKKTFVLKTILMNYILIAASEMQRFETYTYRDKNTHMINLKINKYNYRS